MLNDKISNAFEQTVGGRFASLLESDTELEPEAQNQKIKSVLREAAEKEFGFQHRKKVPGLAEQIIKLCEKRREAKIKLLKDSNNNQLKNDFKLINKEVKNAVRRQKNENLQPKILEMEKDFRKNNTQKLFNSVKQLERKKLNSLLAVKDTNGDLHIKTNDILNILIENFHVKKALC